MKKIDTSVLDRAIIFATKAHADVERRGKGFPYIVHPMEAAAICATMTDDQDILAAAMLHDVIEDTEYTYEDIKREFGERIAELVKLESEVMPEGLTEEESWHMRKQQAMDRIKGGTRDSKMVALGDKLSNMRAIKRDYDEQGDAIWNIFHAKDVESHEWHYRGLADSLRELEDTEAFKEFEKLIDDVFLRANMEFSYKIEGQKVYFKGIPDKEDIENVFAELTTGIDYIFDFMHVGSITFAGMRALRDGKRKGYRFVINSARYNVAIQFFDTGLDSEISISRKAAEVDINHWEKFGGGYAAVSLNSRDGDAMLKLYEPAYSVDEVYDEQRMSSLLVRLGLDVPLVGGVVNSEERYGVAFERIKNKKSFARACSENPERIREYAEKFADMAKVLHSTKCDTTKFVSMNSVKIAQVERTEGYTAEEKEKIIGFINSIEEVPYCVHGDFHHGNVLIADDMEVFIDLGEFAYGDPRYDIGSFMYQTYGLPEEQIMKLFHMTRAQVIEFWETFAYKYYGFATEKELRAKEEELKPFGAIFTVRTAAKFGLIERRKENIQKWLLDRI